ncbi:MAG: capsular polysaccharide biosynthesis protein, partial [Pseudomonadota bacterium]
NLIRASIDLPESAHARAARLIETLTAAGVSKYNVGSTTLPNVPDSSQSPRILVPGQVENDASLQFGGGDVRTNLGLLQAARAANPDATILFKPHPDVEAGLRPGAVPNASDWADHVLAGTDPIAAIRAVDSVWTMTSLLGFEALLHGRTVHCLGHPFYAGWGLTQDVARHPRRTPGPTLTGLVHAALIDYPRYFAPHTGRPCPPEFVADHLARGATNTQGYGLRTLAKVQGVFASYAHLWR